MPPPLMEGLSSNTGMDQNAQGSGNGGSADATAAIMGKLRDVGQTVTDLASSVPAFAPEVKQIQNILKRMISKAAQRGPQESASATQLPGA